MVYPSLGIWGSTMTSLEHQQPSLAALPTKRENSALSRLRWPPSNSSLHCTQKSLWPPSGAWPRSYRRTVWGNQWPQSLQGTCCCTTSPQLLCHLLWTKGPAGWHHGQQSKVQKWWIWAQAMTYGQESWMRPSQLTSLKTFLWSQMRPSRIRCLFSNISFLLGTK